MYEKHFGLTERPFSIAPDPRFLYMSRQHREALAHLLYGVGEGGGFVQLTGEVGTGKTTICRCFLAQLPEHVDVALILNPRVTALELLASLCDELRIQYARDTTSIKLLIDVLNAYLLQMHAKGRRTVLMIDEAQNLSAEVLEQIRLLTNLETTREKLLQIILIGQPELRELLSRQDLRQLSQRITARYHLQPIHRSETEAYIQHRLELCGVNDTMFSEKAVDLIHKLSAGVPRLINVLCDRAMLGAFVEGKRQIDARIVMKAAREVLPEEGLEAPKSGIWRWMTFGGAAAITALIVYFLDPLDQRPPVTQLVTKPVASAVVEEVPETPVMRAPPVAQLPVAAVPVPDELSKPASLEPKPRTLLELSLMQAGPGAASSAWSTLYKLWGLQLSPVTGEQACALAPSAGLRCLQGEGNWALLEQYDRPVVMWLTSPQGQSVAVLLQEVAGTQARIQVDGHGLDIALEELEHHWSGEYRLLWKSPPQGNSTLRPGDRGADVRWLRDRLQEVTGLTAISPDDTLFGAGLKELLQSFQRSHQLDADGVAGPQTLIYLNNATKQPSIPRLGAVAASG